MWRHIARTLRHGPLAAPAGPVDAAAVRDLASRLEAASVQRMGRGLSIFVVDAGDCGGCAAELRMLDSAVHDLQRFGLRFVASPRQADVLLVSGPVTRNLHAPLMQAWDAAPDPKFVVAVGDCAIDGGVFKGSYATLAGVGDALAVDLVIRGCPPTPAQLLNGLRILLEASALVR